MNPYSASFFESLRDSARSSARFVVPLVLSWINAKSVVDIGCGSGTWLSVVREHGIDEILGIDGDYVTPESLEIPATCFLAHDLSRPLRLPRRFDLAISLEVAEHLTAECADLFIESLVRLAPVVLFSAAAPHQGGTNHLNERWPAYWAERFAGHRYFPVDCLRRRLWNEEGVAWWYAQNTFLYVSEPTLQQNRQLREEHAACPVALPLVHPQRYLEWVEWGLAQMQRADQAFQPSPSKGSS